MSHPPNPWRTDPPLRQLVLLGAIATALAVLSVCVVAFAAGVTGTPADDQITGTRGADSISALAGADLVRALAGDDVVSGGTGHDRLDGGDGGDRLDGGLGADRVEGGRGSDLLRGGYGDDRLAAGAGRDELFGGPGDDRLSAQATTDVAPGAPDLAGDALYAEAGNDTLHARDGEADLIDCGEGSDTALLDPLDVIADGTAANPAGSCERVVRGAPPGDADDRAPR